jgi:hypothetical protein
MQEDAASALQPAATNPLRGSLATPLEDPQRVPEKAPCNRLHLHQSALASFKYTTSVSKKVSVGSCPED